MNDVKDRILDTASTLFYRHGVRAVGVDLVAEQAKVAKTSLYRHFGTKDDLVAAFLQREDDEFWQTWDAVSARHAGAPREELLAHLAWIGERVERPLYRGCPQINVAAEFPEPEHPARKVAYAHKMAMRQRLLGIANGLGVAQPERLGGQLAVLINGAFVSGQMFSAGEAVPLLQSAALALLAAS